MRRCFRVKRRRHPKSVFRNQYCLCYFQPSQQPPKLSHILCYSKSRAERNSALASMHIKNLYYMIHKFPFNCNRPMHKFTKNVYVCGVFVSREAPHLSMIAMLFYSFLYCRNMCKQNSNLTINNHTERKTGDWGKQCIIFSPIWCDSAVHL